MGINLAILTGAGLSIPAQIPNTQEITGYLLGEERACFPGGRKTGDSNKRQRDILEFLQLIKGEIEGFYSDKEINYEDLFYVITQIKDFSVENGNPLVGLFLEYLRGSFYHLLSNEDIIRLAQSTADYIIDLIVCLLTKESPELNYLDFIKKADADSSIDNITFYSLNHDLILEKYLQQEKIIFCDGFKYDCKGIGYWQPDLFLRDYRVKLLKLHGSINWYRLIPRDGLKDGKGFFASIGKEQTGFQHSKYWVSKPLILTGRYNKILGYNHSIYVDLHYYFYRLLPQADYLIITGYSFGDMGINSWIDNWLSSFEDKKLLLLEPRPQKTIAKSPADFLTNWASWEQEKKVAFYPVPIEEANWEEIIELFKQLTNCAIL